MNPPPRPQQLHRLRRALALASDTRCARLVPPPMRPGQPCPLPALGGPQCRRRHPADLTSGLGAGVQQQGGALAARAPLKPRRSTATQLGPQPLFWGAGQCFESSVVPSTKGHGESRHQRPRPPRGEHEVWGAGVRRSGRRSPTASLPPTEMEAGQLKGSHSARASVWPPADEALKAGT